MRRLAAHHAVIFSRYNDGLLPCACYLLHGTLDAWILPAASPDAARVGRGGLQNSSAGNPKAKAASLMRLVVEATALLGPERNLHLQQECLSLLAQLARECSAADLREFVGARGPVLLQVLGQLAPALEAAQPHQQDQESAKGLATAKLCVGLLGTICMLIGGEGKCYMDVSHLVKVMFKHSRSKSRVEPVLPPTSWCRLLCYHSLPTCINCMSDFATRFT